MTNNLTLINEPFGEMFLGKNTTLSYICACAELGHEIHIYDLSQQHEILNKNRNANLKVFHLKRADALLLAQKFREENAKIKKLRQLSRYDELAVLDNTKVSAILPQNFTFNHEINLRQVDFVLQRLEPMKSPFPPQGNHKVFEVMKFLRNLFDEKIFNCPITADFKELEDKEIPQEINRRYRAEIATPTAQFKLQDHNFSAAINFAGEKYREIFNEKNREKIVIKPKNSAQSLGVFAIEFSTRGFDLETLKSKKISELANVQIYKIVRENLGEIIKILCFVQRVKEEKKYHEIFIGDISHDEIFNKAQELYNAKILAQPFLEGITLGDVRANILKDENQNFYCAGTTFRSSNREEINDEFTTCYTTGGAVSKPISFLSINEQKSLMGHLEIVLKILNHEMRQQYKNIVELGADFILVGNQKSVMLGEINHHCPALLPISEAMSEKEYDQGLAYSKKAISAWMNLQK